MQLHRLIYASRFKQDADPSELTRIHVTATRNNEDNGITGVLVFGNDYFLQYIEGTGSALNRLFRNILNDSRHLEITMINYSEISERQFDGWSMKLFILTSENLKMAQEMTNSDDYEPQKMNADMALKFLSTFKA